MVRAGKHRYLIIASVIVAVAGGGALTRALFLGGGGAPQSSSDIELQRGLVGWWKLDGNGKDSTPYADNGVATGSPASSTDRQGTAGSAMTFDGSSNYYTVSNSPKLQITGNETISLWVKPTSFASRQNPFCKAYGGEGCITQETSGKLTYYWGTAGGNASPYQQLTSSVSLTLNSWNHVAIVRDITNTSLTWYINGVQSGSATTSYAAATASTLPLYIGNGYAGKYAGSVDDARLYNRALSSAEVTYLYKSYNSSLALGSGENGLIGWWKLNGNTLDSTPNASNGIDNGASPTTDRQGMSNSAYNFNGSSNIDIANNSRLNVANTMSASAWFYPTSNASYQVIFSKVPSGYASGWEIANSSGVYRATIRGATINVQAGSITLNTWHQIAFTYNGTTITLYADGVSIGSATGSATLNSTADAMIGARASDGSDFNGKIDDVRLYNRALSASEIANLYSSYNSTVSLYSATNSGSSVNLSSGLVGEWDFNGNARDATPYGNNGTVSGATLTSDRNGRANSAYQLGDSGAWINVGNPAVLNGANGFTYNIWLTRAGASVYHWPEIMGSSNTHINYGIRSGNYGDGIYFEYGKSPYDGSAFAGTSGITLPTGQWHMYTVTYDGSNIKTYWDGVFKQTVTGVALDPTYGGMSFTTSANGWNGTIDDARAWNRALSQAEITDLYSVYR